jgi:hypothetical protein
LEYGAVGEDDRDQPKIPPEWPEVADNRERNDGDNRARADPQPGMGEARVSDRGQRANALCVGCRRRAGSGLYKIHGRRSVPPLG